MKLYTLYLSGGEHQEVFANNHRQAFACARGEVMGYTATSDWDWS